MDPLFLKHKHIGIVTDVPSIELVGVAEVCALLSALLVNNVI